MKRKLFSLLTFALLLALLAGTALADGESSSRYIVSGDYSWNDNYPLYVVDSYSPYGYCYMYDSPTSTYGENLGRYNNGELLKVISTKTGNEYYLVVDQDNQAGFVNGACLIPYDSSRDYPIYYVDSVQPLGYCYMYDRPSSTYGENLGRYNNGELFAMLDWDANRNYAYVCSVTTGKTGYVSKSALVLQSDSALHQTATITSKMGYIYLYDRPSSTYGENLGRYENYEKVYILKWKYDKNYAQVKTMDGKTGYMQMDRLTLDN